MGKCVIWRVGELLSTIERAFEGCAHKLAPPLHTSPAEQSLYDILDVAFRESDVVANLPIGEASHDPLQDIPLAVLHMPARPLNVKSRISINYLTSQPLNDLLIDPCPAVSDEPDGL
jgi:hypothetical protein